MTQPHHHHNQFHNQRLEEAYNRATPHKEPPTTSYQRNKSILSYCLLAAGIGWIALLTFQLHQLHP